MSYPSSLTQPSSSQHTSQHNSPASASVLAASYPAIVETKKITKVHDEYHPSWRMLNSYRMEHTIGTGSFGKVKKARDMTTNREVAIKILRRLPDKKRLSKTPASQSLRFRNEIAIMKKCQNEYIVRLYEVIDDPRASSVYLVMEYCEGGQILWNDKDGLPLLTIEQIKRIIRDVILGLDFLHLNGIIHRDIKPANLLWTKNRARVKITDFGTAHYSAEFRLAPRKTSPMRRRGNGATSRSPTRHADHPTPRVNGEPNQFLAPANPESPPSDEDEDQEDYSSNISNGPLSAIFAAPELCFGQTGREPPRFPEGQRPLGVKTDLMYPVTNALDLWAFGVTIYCLLFGKVPWLSQDRYQLFHEIIDREPEEWPTATCEELALDNEDLDLQEALRIRRGLMKKLVHERMSIEALKTSIWLEADPEDTPAGPVFLSEDDADEAVVGLKGHPQFWPKFYRQKHKKTPKQPIAILTRKNRLQSASQVRVDQTNAVAHKDKGKAPANRASIDAMRRPSGRRSSGALSTPFGGTLTSLSAASSPSAALTSESYFSKQQQDSSQSTLSKFVNRIFGLTKRRSKPHNAISASAEPIAAEHKFEDATTQLAEHHSTSFPAGFQSIGRRAASIADNLSYTENEGQDIALITYETTSEEDYDDDDVDSIPTFSEVPRIFGFNPRLPNPNGWVQRGRAGTSSREMISSPLRSTSDGSVPAEPPRVYGQYRQHTTGRQFDRDDSFDFGSPSSPISPASPPQEPLVMRRSTSRGPRQSSMVRSQRRTFTNEDDDDSDSDALVLAPRNRRDRDSSPANFHR